MNHQTEIELKFQVPVSSRTAVATEMARVSKTFERRTLAAKYLDTSDRRLAQAGLAWRLRREGRRWIQTLKAGGANAIERFEHEVIRPDDTFDPCEHAGSDAGDRLLSILGDAHDDGIEVGVRFRTEVRRTARRVRTRGAVVEVAFDEGRLLAGDARQRIREIEFELVSGSAAAMIALAERWRKRFALIYDPRSKAERGDRLADGSPFPKVRKARRPDYPEEANATEALGVVLDECLAQITHNAIGLIDGDPGSRVEHVHQARVGIRRLRSALRSFDGWTPAPPEELVDGLRALFATLGESRDSDVLDSGVASELVRVGAPALSVPAGEPGPDPAEAVRDGTAQRLFLAWIAWRASLAEQPAVAPGEDAPVGGTGTAVSSSSQPGDVGEGGDGGDGGDGGEGGEGAQGAREEGREAMSPAAGAGNGEASDTAEDPQGRAAEPAAPAGKDAERTVADAKNFHRELDRRLRRWHRRIARDARVFDELDEERLHSLRKRIKRQRYAVEFFASVLGRRKVERYLEPLTAIQDRMGALNDLFVARERYQSILASDPAAWFAIGWLAARIEAVRALAKPELGRLAKADSPTC